VLKVLGNVAREAVPVSFGVAFLRAIFAGWLIALMVWLLPAAESARVSIIVILTYLIGLGGFAHIVAGSTKVMFGVLIGAVSWPIYFGKFMPPTLAGNIAGGVALVAALGTRRLGPAKIIR
jgi:formate/nitrite transporter FocA (FNT family)